MPSDRCGYVSTVEGIADVGSSCCYRPVREGDDRCVWHTEGAVTREEYEQGRPEPGERLDGARLANARLAGTDWLAGCGLVGADLTGAVLADATLDDADLRQATLHEANARGASFDGAVLHDASVEYADLRDASFRDAELYRVNLREARVDLGTHFDDTSVYERRWRADREADEAGEGRTAEDDFEAATWVYRELQRLFEDNALPERERAYDVREQDLRRRHAWASGRYHQALFLGGSRWIMRYGTSPWRILATSAVLIVVSALLYPLTGGIREVAGDETITYAIEDPEATPVRILVQVFFKSLYFSVVTFSSLGYGDIQPVGGSARLIASVETLLGTLLLALLIFVLTRRFR